MPTIRDVATHAGVSPTTVSYVLNGTRFVKPETAIRIRRAIQDLGYKPDQIARSLRAKRTMTAGMIVSDISNPFYADIVRGVEETLSARHYGLILCNTHEAPERELLALDLLREKRVDGVVAVATGSNVDPFYQACDAGLPIVLVDRQLPGNRLDTVIVDDTRGATEAVQYLIRLGHRRIGLIAGREGISTTEHRRQGYNAALREAGMTPDPDLVRDGRSTVEGGAAAARAMLDLPVPPTAILATNNLMTVGLFATIKERQLGCPENIAVVGFDDMVWLAAFTPGVTTVVQPGFDLGERAAVLLWGRMTDKRTDDPQIAVLPAHLVIRESCGRARDSIHCGVPADTKGD